MAEYPHALVGLSLNELSDRSTLTFLSVLAPALGLKRAHFLHVAESPDVPEEILRLYPGLGEPDDSVRDRLRERVARHFKAPAVHCESDVACGSPLSMLLQHARRTSPDLLVIGRKNNNRVVLPDMLARKSPCSTLLVPEGVSSEIPSILVPVDFSQPSRDALATAVILARGLGLPEISCLHVYDVPLGYHSLGQSHDEAATIMLENAQERFAEMRARLDAKVEIAPLFQLDKRPADAILEEIERLGPGLVVMGARGCTKLAAMLLGSVTERMLRTVPVPLLVVKAKGQGLSLLEAFLGG